MKRIHPANLRLEQLEGRETPATLVSPTKITYQDIDGDDVSVTFSKPILNNGNVNTIFRFQTGTVDGSNATKQQLYSINLANVTAAGTRITTKAVISKVNGGDGFASLGHIDATGRDLGAVVIDGDLGAILAGDTATSTTGLVSLTAQSLGQFGASGGYIPDTDSSITGELGALTVKGDLKGGLVYVHGGENGKIGSVTVGGNLAAAGGVGGEISSEGAIGSVKIAGNVVGGSQNVSGRIFSGGSLASVSIGGDLTSGTGDSSGEIFSKGAMGPVKILGNVTGGSGIESGFIWSQSSLASVTIGGNLTGGNGNTSGTVLSDGAMGAVTIAGNVTGIGSFSGRIDSGGALVSVTIGGDLTGGVFSGTGEIVAAGTINSLKIKGNVVGGGSTALIAGLVDSGYIQAQRINTLAIGGSLISGTNSSLLPGTFHDNGAIRVNDDIGTATIGNIIGNATNPAIISARGKANPTTTDLAIGSLRVHGRVEFALILAGYDAANNAVNADAQIGPVTVEGDWIASSLVAGATAGGDGLFGTADDVPITGGKAAIVSKITNLRIAGQAIGTVGGTDGFGIVAENVGAVKVGGTSLALKSGSGNDNFFVGTSDDFKVREL